MWLLLLLWIFLWIILFSLRGKYRLQGGEISTPKKFWLSFALFVYYPLPVYLMLKFGFHPVLIAGFGLFFIRLPVQAAGMYILKNWSPKTGIFFNLLAVVVVFSVLMITPDIPLPIMAYGILVVVCTAIDAFYAHRFWKIVGEKTKGDQPIWFASNSKEFVFLNRLTSVMNILLYGFFFWAYFPDILPQ